MSDEIKKQSRAEKAYLYLVGAVVGVVIITADVYELTLLGNVLYAGLGLVMLLIGLWHLYLFVIIGFYKATGTLNEEKVKKGSFTHYLLLLYCFAFGLVLPVSGSYLFYLAFTGQAAG